MSVSPEAWQGAGAGAEGELIFEFGQAVTSPVDDAPGASEGVTAPGLAAEALV